MQTHVKVVAVLFIIFGALAIMLAFFSTLLFSVLGSWIGASAEEGAAAGGAVMGLVGVIVMIALLVYAVPAFVCGWALLNRKSWARIMGIILAAISLVKIPFGTIFGIYALWVLLNKDTERFLAPPSGAA